MNNSPFWLDLAIELKKQNLAEPNFWLGYNAFNELLHDK
jgi:hypothetical protein